MDSAASVGTGDEGLGSESEAADEPDALEALMMEHYQALAPEAGGPGLGEQQLEELALAEVLAHGAQEEGGPRQGAVERMQADRATEEEAAPVAGLLEEAVAAPAALEGAVEAPALAAEPAVDDGGRMLRQRAELAVDVPNGRITYYNKGFFTATCAVHSTGTTKCVMSRSAEPGRKAAQGRPLGLMMGWLFSAHEFPDKSSHWNKEHWPTFEVRSAQRDVLAELPGGRELLDKERPQEPGEAEEPDGLA